MPDCPARNDVALAAWTSAFGRLEAQLFATDPARSDRLAVRYAREHGRAAVWVRAAPRWQPRGLSSARLNPSGA
jgi:hypothetical protein